MINIICCCFCCCFQRSSHYNTVLEFWKLVFQSAHPHSRISIELLHRPQTDTFMSPFEGYLRYSRHYLLFSFLFFCIDCFRFTTIVAITMFCNFRDGAKNASVNLPQKGSIGWQQVFSNILFQLGGNVHMKMKFSA